MAEKSITGLKLLETDLARSEPNLETRRDKIKNIKGNISKIQIANGLSHESRNKLRAIGKQSHALQAAGIKHKKDKDIKAAPHHKVKKDHLKKKASRQL